MRVRSIARIALAASLALPATATAQAAGGGSILWLVRPAGRLQLDTPTSGALSASDFFGPTDAYLDVWELEGRAGGSVTIDMRSPDFDALLYVVGPGMAETLSDDDGGGRCDARVSVRFLEDGIYRVAATVNGARTTGVYSLFASVNPGPAPEIPCGGPDPAMFAALPVAGTLTVGTPLNGSLGPGDPTLENGALAEVWALAGTEGATVRIRLESDAFDSFLYVIGPDGESILTDDDGGGDLHAEIEFTFPASGTCRVVVSSADNGSGAFVLTVTSGAGG